jgi:hypothetical protein
VSFPDDGFAYAQYFADEDLLFGVVQAGDEPEGECVSVGGGLRVGYEHLFEPVLPFERDFFVRGGIGAVDVGERVAELGDDEPVVRGVPCESARDG